MTMTILLCLKSEVVGLMPYRVKRVLPAAPTLQPKTDLLPQR